MAVVDRCCNCRRERETALDRLDTPRPRDSPHGRDPGREPAHRLPDAGSDPLRRTRPARRPTPCLAPTVNHPSFRFRPVTLPQRRWLTRPSAVLRQRDTKMRMNVMAMARAERAEMAEVLESLRPEQGGPSLCAGWRVRDVVAHVVSYEEHGNADLAKRFV